MSQTQPLPGAQAAQEAIDDLMDEIRFQKVILTSIDDCVEDREAVQGEVRAEIKRLEKEIKILRRGPGAAITEPATSSTDSFAAKAASGSNSSIREPDALTNDIPCSLSSPRPSTTNSTNSISDLLTPSKMSLPNRKRSHSNHLDGLVPVTGSKSRRTSPSPFLSRHSTPSSTSGYDSRLSQLIVSSIALLFWLKFFLLIIVHIRLCLAYYML
jgi:hypothetical protein